MKNTEEGSNNEDIFLMRHNTQFNDDDDENTENIPTLYDQKEELYNHSISAIIGPKSWVPMVGRDGGAFHVIMPVSREVEYTVDGAQKKSTGDIVFIIDRKLQAVLDEYKSKKEKRMKIKGSVFKVVIDKAEDPDKDVAKFVNPNAEEAANKPKDAGENVEKDINKEEIFTDLNNFQAEKQKDAENQKKESKFAINPPRVEFAKPYKYFYLEFRLFKEVRFWEFLTADKSDYMNLGGLEWLLDNCFILYWPEFKPTYNDLEANAV